MTFSLHRHLFRLLLIIAGLLILSACEFPSPATPGPIIEVTFPVPTSTPVPLPTETAVPLLPTRPATPMPLPTPTYDPKLADWTVMIYLDADNSLDSAGIADLNEMEAAGASKQVNLLVQMDRSDGVSGSEEDWTGARRFVVQGDENLAEIATEPDQLLGEVNMGDPEVLEAFLVWGMRSYPANRYALILWDHGAGWRGIAFDENVGFDNQSDNISLGDLSAALDGALSSVGVPAIDLIGFDACLMAQLDVYQAIQPYARYAVGSEELTPNQGWNYRELLSQLYDEPSQGGAEFAQLIAREFAEYYRRVEPDDFVTISAVDLQRLPDVTYAVENLASWLSDNPSQAAGMVANARSGSEAFARVYADQFDQYAAVDLYHFSSILAQRSLDTMTVQSAEEVLASLSQAVIANETGAGFKNSGGVSVYFPRTSAFYAPEYADTTKMPMWAAFLASYHQASTEQAPPSQIGFTAVLTEGVGSQNPAYLEFEIVGRDIEQVKLVGGVYEADGRTRLLEFDTLIPEPTYLPDGSQLFEWRDGLHEDFFVWYTEVTYLFDSAGNGDFAVMWPTNPGSTLYTVDGRFRRGDGRAEIDARLVFDQQDGQLKRVWGVQNGAAAELMPQPGDVFRLYTLYWAGDGEVLRESGPELVFGDDRQLYFDWRPLPDGAYYLGITVENRAGIITSEFRDLTVDNSRNQPGFHSYLDPFLGFQFLLPEDWYRPVHENGLVYSSNFSDTTRLQITIYPELRPGEDANTLKNETLARYGPVDLLYPAENVVIGDIRGQRFFYGYERAGAGPHTGAFLTAVKDGRGYVIDLDGPQATEANMIMVLNKLIESWQFRPVDFGLQPGAWASVDLDGFTVAQPSSFSYQEVHGWQRFSRDRDIFVALRSEPESLSAADVLEALLRDAGAGVAGFEAEVAVEFPFAGAVWLRSNFEYKNSSDADIWGFIMVKIEDGREVVAWAEAPDTLYNSLESDVFLMMIADLNLAD